MPTKVNTAGEIKSNVEKNALAIGQITMQWTTIQVGMSYLFRKLSGLDKTRAEIIFFSVKSDTNQREMTLALARTVLSSQPELLGKLEKIFDKIGRYSGERNAAAHTMWIVKMPDGKVMPYPTASHHRRLNIAEHEKQFERLLSNLSKIFREMVQLDADIARALNDRSRARVKAPETDSLGTVGKP